MGKLTVRGVNSLTLPGRYSDGGSLYLNVAARGSKSWVLLWARMEAGRRRQREMGLGGYPAVPLAEAREAAQEAMKQIRRGIDPIAAKRKPAGLLFETAAKQFIEAHEGGWRNPKHAAQWPSSLSTYAYPKIGKVPVDAITTDDVLRVLKPIWSEKTETAVRVRGRIEQILDWAKAQGLRAGDNPAAWRGHLDKLLPAPTKIRTIKHHAALPYASMPAFYSELRECDGIAPLALRWTILTGVRTADTVTARIAHVDPRAKVWIIPEFSKTRLEHRVPLSDAAIAVFDEAHAMARRLGLEAELLFPNPDTGEVLSENSMLAVLARMNRKGVATTHGFRATMRTWLQEWTAFPWEIMEMSLGHKVGDDVQRAYQRGDVLEKRRAVMAAWGDFCTH